MAKIVLIKPPHIYAKVNFNYYSNGLPPIGLAYIASALVKNQHEVKVIDGFGEDINQYINVVDSDFYIHGSDLDEIVERIPKDTLYIGVACMFSNEWLFYRYLILKIREKFPSAFLFIGGEHASADYDYILKSNLGINAVVIGEGEETCVELIEGFIKGARLENIKGLAFYNDETSSVHKTPTRMRMKNLSSVIPHWDIFPIQKYLDYKAGMDSYNMSTLPILASRGCPYTCTFCSSPQMWGTDYQARSPVEIVREMHLMKTKFPTLEHFIFTDLTTTLNRDWTLDLAREITKSKLDITWSIGAGTRSEVMIPEVLDALKESGYVRNIYATESGSDETLKRIQKKLNLTRLMKSIKYAVKINLPTKATFILGFPGQSLKECWQSYFFSLKLAFMGLDEIVVYSYSPYPGSELFEELISKKEIVRNYDPKDLSYDNLLASIMFSGASNKSWSEHFSKKTLFFFYFLFNISFILVSFSCHPSKWKNLFFRFKENKPVTNVERLLHFLIKKPRKNYKSIVFEKSYDLGIMLTQKIDLNEKLCS